MNFSIGNIIVGVFGLVIYTFFIWNAGFNSGADTVMCAVTYTQTNQEFNAITYCQSANIDGIFQTIRQNLPESFK